VRFVLKEGVEIHRIEPSTEVYDYDTGKLVGHVGPRGRFVPLGGRSGTIKDRRYGDSGLLTVLSKGVPSRSDLIRNSIQV